MVTTGTIAVLQCCSMLLAWCEWQCWQTNQHTWNNCWVSHWMAAFTKVCDISHLTSSNNTFGVNPTVADNISQQMVNSLDNLSYAAVACNTTLELLITNQKRAKTIADLTAAIAVLGSRWTTHQMPVTVPPTQQYQPQAQQQSQRGWTYYMGPKPP